MVANFVLFFTKKGEHLQNRNIYILFRSSGKSDSNSNSTSYSDNCGQYVLWEQSSFYSHCPGPGGSLGSSGLCSIGSVVAETGKELAEVLSKW